MIRYLAVAALFLVSFIAGVAFARAGDADFRLQRELNRQGCDAGDPDGVIGEQTRSAIRCFQRRHGLEVTGEATGRTLRYLFGGERPGTREEAVDDILSGGTAAAITIDRRAFGTCGELTIASGEQKYMESRAKAEALRVWQTEVAKRYGTDYVGFHRAQNAKIRCRPACATCKIRFECEVSAVPCRDE